MIKDPKLFSVPSKTNLKSKPEPTLGSKTSALVPNNAVPTNPAPPRRPSSKSWHSYNRGKVTSISTSTSTSSSSTQSCSPHQANSPHFQIKYILHYLTSNFSSEPPTLTSNPAFPSLWIQDPVYVRQIPTTSWLSPKRIPSW
jgi:hypothetical protein